MSLVILEPGLHSLPVDLGRTGARSLGVPLGGAADRFAFQLGNLLLGNPSDAVSVEVTLKGPTLRAMRATVAVVFGAPFKVTVNDFEVSPNTTFRLHPGDVLRIGGTPTGCRAYLCVAGGFAVPQVLGSRSGLEPLRAGEVLRYGVGGGSVGRGIDWNPSPLGERGRGEGESGSVTDGRDRWPNSPKSPSPLTPLPQGREGLRIRTLPGPQADWFPDGGFFGRAFTVAAASNRMGIRLLGEPIPKRAGELASEPVAPGAVQVTNDGLPIVLGVDGQTVGGYPKVAHVIRADLDVLGQSRPGDTIRFAVVSPAEAEQAAADRARELRRWAARLALAGQSAPVA